jgi:hypothetical protein
MYATTRQQFLADGFNLLMLLPDDDVDIGERAGSLGRWCLGFLTGFGAARGKLSGDGRETLEDLEKISQIDDEGLEADEDSEQDMMQLVEYVRMAAIMLYTEVHTPGEADGDKPQPSLH